MTDKPSVGKPPAHASKTPEPAPSGEHEEDATTPVAPVEEPDPFEELWDPDMDTRPERIRRTRARTRPEPRTRGGGPPRGKRRDGV
jgi:hypothetical protein